MPAENAAEMYLPHFVVKQKLTMMINRYEVSRSNPAGNPTRLMALAEQKRMAFKEQVTFYSDETQVARRVRLQGPQARSTSTPATTSPTRAAHQIGFFRKDFGASPAALDLPHRGPGLRGHRPGAQPGGGLLRRFTDSRSCRSTSTSSTPRATPLFSVERKVDPRPLHRDVPDQRVDFRVAAAVAVGLDALMQR